MPHSSRSEGWGTDLIRVRPPPTLRTLAVVTLSVLERQNDLEQVEGEQPIDQGVMLPSSVRLAIANVYGLYKEAIGIVAHQPTGAPPDLGFLSDESLQRAELRSAGVARPT